MYVGRSGQLAVMSELLTLGCNVAVPEIDVGQDVFAFKDDEETIARIQVKAANAKVLKREGTYSAQISLPLEQLEHADRPKLYYVFVIRLSKHWTDAIVIRRAALQELRLAKKLGSVYQDAGKSHVKLDLKFTPDDVTCSGESLKEYRNAWTNLPPLHVKSEEKADK